MRASIFSPKIGTAFFLATICSVSGQTASQTQATQQSATSTSTQTTTQEPPTLQAFLQLKQTLIQQRQALMAQGATAQQLVAWTQQNATQFATLGAMAESLGAQAELLPRPTNFLPNIPANASLTMTAFLTTKAALTNARAQIHNQLLAAMPLSVTTDQIQQMDQQEAQLFQQQYAATVQVQAQRAQTLANESAQTPSPVPDPIEIPLNTTPQLAAYLTLNDQLIRERMQIRNQYVNADPSARDSAMQQWQQANASRLQQLNQLAQNLGQTSPTIQN